MDAFAFGCVVAQKDVEQGDLADPRLANTRDLKALIAEGQKLRIIEVAPGLAGEQLVLNGCPIVDAQTARSTRAGIEGKHHIERAGSAACRK
jgi:hypothetical protein